MKVVLVNPPLLEDFPSSSCFPNLGLASLAATLEKHNFEVKIIDAPAERLSIEACAQEVLRESPDLVGLSAMTPTYPSSLKIAKFIKENSKIATCIGGSHVTFLPDESMQTNNFDYLVKGEGEHTFLELCHSLKDNKPVRDIKGISFIQDKKVFHNENRELIQNLDELPRYAYHLLPFKKYQKRAPPEWVRRKPWLTYCGSRGCPFGCRFCSSSYFWGKKWRAHSVQRLVDDFLFLSSEYNLKSLFICDDNFTFWRQRILDLCEKLRENKLEMEWICNCRVDQIDSELISAMHAAGCWRIGFGIEAGTQEVLDWYGKKVNLEQIKKAIKACKEVGVSPLCYFMIGAPIETEEMIKKTIDFAKELDPDVVAFSHLVPLPGSTLYSYSIEKNLFLTKSWEKFGVNYPAIKSKVSTEDLQRLSKQAYREFYFRPKYMVKQIKNAIREPKITWDGFMTVLNWVRQK